MTTVAEVCRYLDRFAPPTLAADWDNVGLLLGDGAETIRSVLTCLTITPEVVQEAVEAGIGLIVSHHPILFRGAKRITSQNTEGRMLWTLAKANIAVYSPHTAFDNAVGGINDFLAQLLGLQDVQPLKRRIGRPMTKIVAFVPQSDLQKVSDAMFAAGAGEIGNYRQCSFRLSGTGTFFGGDAANPAVGQKGRREEVAEDRLEILCPEAVLEPVLAALRRAHSYEEPAFDVYPLKVLPGTMGEGRVGLLPEPMTLEAFARRAKEVFGTAVMQYQGPAMKQVRRVAIVCGAGGALLNDVFRAKADAFVTGELRFHDTLSALSHDLAVVLPGHYASERLAVEALAGRLQGEFGDLRIGPSRAERDPSQWV